MSKIEFSAFSGEDMMKRFQRAMAFCRENPGTELVIEPGVYEITSDLAREAQEHVMSGDWGRNPQRIMFSPSYKFTRGLDFAGQRGITISADGVTLLVDGFMEPVSVRGCSDIEIRGLTIDHKRKPFSEGKVRILSKILAGEEAGKTNAVIRMNEDCPVKRETPLTLRYLFIDEETGRILPCSIDHYSVMDARSVNVILRGEITDGAIFSTIHTYHSRPAILIENAENIRLRDVTIHSQPGMGIVGNRSENITLTGLRVVPAPGWHWSTNTDATHFTSIKGTLRFENCECEGQGDDFTNVHGYYQAVVKKESPTVAFLREKTPDGTHAQTLDYPDPGDQMELTDYKTLAVTDVYTVVKSEPDPAQRTCRVEFDRDLPKDLDGKMLADVTRLPRLEVIGCRASNHFARSVLIKTRDALIEGNTFRGVQGPAIVAAAEAHWYEGVCPANIVIRGNKIENCGWAWGEAAGIVIKADADEPSGQSIYGITIEGNEIDAPSADHAIYCRNVRGLRISGNKTNTAGAPVVIENCADAESDA